MGGVPEDGVYASVNNYDIKYGSVNLLHSKEGGGKSLAKFSLGREKTMSSLQYDTHQILMKINVTYVNHHCHSLHVLCHDACLPCGRCCVDPHLRSSL